MPIAYTLGNGNLLTGIDKFGQVSEFYFPGKEFHNLLGAGLVNRIGIRTNSSFSWMSEWDIEFDGFTKNSFRLSHPNYPITIKIKDDLVPQSNSLIRRLQVINNSQESNLITLYFNQQFQFPSFKSDTAYFDPESKSIVHYGQGLCVVTKLGSEQGSFTEYSIGLKGLEGMQGAYVNAESGNMSNNPVEHGKVDSVVSMNLEFNPHQELEIVYTNTAGSEILATIQTALDLDIQHQASDDLNISNSIDKTLASAGLSNEAIHLYHRSVSEVVNHTTKDGAIISSSDSGLMVEGRGRYSYVWPRDAAVIAEALTVSGRLDLARDFFIWISERVMQDGSFWHRYNPDGSLGSTWHPKIIGDELVNQNQLDQTGSVLFSLNQYFKACHDIGLIRDLFDKFILPAGTYLSSQLNPVLELNSPSFDLWEAKYGIHTYSLAASYGGLMAAAELVSHLKEDDLAEAWMSNATEFKNSISAQIFSEKTNYFIKGLDILNQQDKIDITRDISSLFGIYKYQLFHYNSNEIDRSVDSAQNHLINPGQTGGVIRYHDDRFFADNSSNPWIICSMWLTQVQLDRAKDIKDLEQGLDWIHWAVSKASPSGMLAEQYHPETGNSISIEPLIWSHAEYILAVHKYLEKHKSLSN